MFENGKGERELELRLIGPVRLLHRSGRELTPKGRKAQGLLALLGVAAGLRLPRTGLQDKLWSDRGKEQGGASLRQELTGLRRGLGEWGRCLVTDGVWVGLDPSLVRVSLEPAPEDWDLTGEAPEFAAGLDVVDREFEDWIRDVRAHFADKFADAPKPAPTPAVRIVGEAVAVAAEAGWPAATAPPIDVEARAPTPSIAVMPVTMQAEDPSMSFMATGLVTDVINRLTRFRRIDVIAHASSAALAPLGLPPRQIGQRLGVRYITQGVLWLGRRRLRLTFNLVDAEREHVLWSRDFDRTFEDIFDVEDEIVDEISAGVMLEVDQQERFRVRARDPNSLDAYGLCLRGSDEMLRLDRAGCDNALDFFTRAEDRERRYARALSGISRAHGFYWKYRWATDREAALVRADDFAVRAVESDANDAAASAALGWVALYSRNHNRSLAAYSRAMEINPSDADILAEYADTLGHSGANEEAIPLFLRAIRLNPQMSDIYGKDLAYVYIKAGHLDDAIRTIQRMRRPEIADLNLTAALALAGQVEAARQAAAGVRRARPGFSPDAWVTMIPDLNPDHTALFLEGLKRAGL